MIADPTRCESPRLVSKRSRSRMSPMRRTIEPRVAAMKSQRPIRPQKPSQVNGRAAPSDRVRRRRLRQPRKQPKHHRASPAPKQDRVVALLQQPGGAALDVLVDATGWQKHSVRGFLAGTVRKKLKLPLISEKVDGIRTYRIGASRAVKAASKRRST